MEVKKYMIKSIEIFIRELLVNKIAILIHKNETGSRKH